MSEWGGTNAESLKNAIDSIFGPFGNIPLADYDTKLVSCTADGASVNFGHISGLLTRISRERDWLLKIHCANHRVELAVKAAFKGSRFAQVDEFYQATNQLLKNSGKLKSMIEAAATALGIEHYVLPKLTGTRFVGHRVRALTRLLDMWPAFKTAFETCLNDPANKNVNPKIKGLLEKFRSYQFLCLVCTYLDVLEKITPASKVFEGEGLLAHEVRPTIDLTLLELRECRDVAGKDEEYLESHLGRFKLQMTEEGHVSLSSEYTMKRESKKIPKIENTLI